MFLVVVLIVLLILPSVLFKPLPKQQIIQTVVHNCPPHKWAYRIINNEERLVCNVCNMLPGSGTYQPRANGEQ